MMKPLLSTCALLVMACSLAQSHAAASPAAEKTTTTSGPGEPAAIPVPAGEYKPDKSHTSLVFRVDHLGFSHFTGRFTRYEAQLQFDPKNIPASRVTVKIDPRSIESDNAPEGFLDLLRGPKFFDTAKYPEMAFRSTRVELTAPNTMRIQGELTLHGVTRPVVLNATYNGGYAGHPMDPHARVGFSAQGTLKRSDFDMGFGIPAPNSRMGVGDEVSLTLESEFSGPPLAGSQAGSSGAQ